jgi:hypothetical protein
LGRACLAALSAVGLSAACGAAAVADGGAKALAPIQEVDVARGDEWKYETRDSLTGDALSDVDVVVVDREADKIDVRLRVVNPATGVQRVGAATFDLFWRKLPDSITPGSGAQDSWGVRRRLKVGDEWSYDYERPLMANSVMMRWIGHGEALGTERVDLPNGLSVDAMKVEFFERPSVARYNNELHVVEWFAPQINRYVRRDVETRWNGQITDSTTDVLLDYVRRR